MEILSYDPLTGIFTWRTPRPKVRVGEAAGSRTHHRGYVYIELFGQAYAAHRLAWFYVHRKWPRQQIDHKNRKRADNRIDNLREASNGQNRANSKHCNKNGFKGVAHHAWLKDNPYQASIRCNKKTIYLGCYPTAKRAHEAYKAAAKKLHGEFSNHGEAPEVC